MSDASPHIANIGRQVEVLSNLKSIFPQVLFHVIEVYSALQILFCRVFFFFFKEMENKMRNTLNDIYFGKTKDIVNALR